MKEKLEKISLRAYTMLAILVLLWLFFHWQTEGIFLTPRNLSNLMLQTSVTGILAVGMLMVIAAGQIDLSVGSVLGLAGGLAAIALTHWEFGVIGSIVLTLMICMLIGALHGFLTAYFSIPAFIVTLGGLLAWRGAIKGLSQGETIPVSDPTFKAIGQANLPENIGWIIAIIAIAILVFINFQRAATSRTVLKILLLSSLVVIFTFVMNLANGIPIPVLLFLTASLFGLFITDMTVFGRYLYAIGGNREAARLSGINTKLNIVIVYIILGALTGLAAIIFTARQASASPDAGVLKELEAIAACVIGGASLVGGRGTVLGA
ncbi:MAG: sugar ABC transporter permease, partial [Anaerolineae bacterium]|nr:sugar ABC transporter permease [Anaerolineae bacterium]